MSSWLPALFLFLFLTREKKKHYSLTISQNSCLFLVSLFKQNVLHCVVTHVNAVAVAITLSTPSESHYQLHYTHWLLLSVLINLHGWYTIFSASETQVCGNTDTQLITKCWLTTYWHFAEGANTMFYIRQKNCTLVCICMNAHNYLTNEPYFGLESSTYLVG